MSMTVEALAHTLRRGVHRDMAKTVMHPVLGHTLEQIVGGGASRLNAFHRLLYEPFERARRVDPLVTFREFLATNPGAARLLRALLGDDQFVLATHLSGPEYFAARAAVLATLRAENPPIAQWMSWGHWGRRPFDPAEIDATGLPHVLPVDFPVARRSGNRIVAWSYPSWSVGRSRLFKNLAYAELLRRLPEGTQIPLDARGAALLRALQLPRDVAAQPLTGMATVRMSTLQVVQTLSTGQSPAVRSVLLQPGQPPPPGFVVSQGPTGRAAEDARWELASRLGDPDLVTQGEFERRIAQHAQATDTKQPAPVDTNPDHPVTTFSNAELVAVARYEHHCPEIANQVLEVDHGRAQRAIPLIEGLLAKLHLVVDGSLVRHLCGLCDPHNLTVVTPGGHAARDFHAHYIGRGNRWNVNESRVPRLARPPGPGRVVRPAAVDPELVDPASFDVEFDEHEDISRAMNVFFGFSPHHLEPVADMFGDPRVLLQLRALGGAEGDTVRAGYNHFAGCINAALRSHEMSTSLLLDLI